MSTNTSPTPSRSGMRPAVLLLIGFCAVFGSLIGAYVYQFDRQLAEENTARLAEVSDSLATHLTTVVADTQTALEAVALAVTALDTDGERLAYLRDAGALYAFAYMGYAGPDGKLHATVPGREDDVRDEAWFQAARAGRRFVSNQVRVIFPDRAATGILLAVPMPGPGEPGALVAMQETRTLKAGLNLENFGGEGHTAIVEKNGAVIMRTRNLDLGNLFTAWQNVRFDGADGLARLQDDIEHKRRGLARFTDMTGRRQYVYHQPLSFNNWTAVTVVAEEAASAKTIGLTRELALGGGLVVALFMGLLFWALRSRALSRESRLAMDAKSAFLANMSHEIRTPMNAIVGISEIMLRDEVAPRQRERLMSILNSGKGLLTIIDDILDLSKIEAGKFTIVDEPYDLEILLYDVTTIAAARIGDKPVNFLVEPSPHLPQVLLGDMDRVRQVLLNLVGNAIKFTERGSVRLLVDGERSGEGWLLRLEVRDTGIGIRPEDLDKLFISFNQVDTRRNRKLKGTGLGLAISRRLCEMMGGGIEVRSAYGKGSSFVATIRQGALGAAPLVAPAAAGISVLLCEPDDELRAFEAASLDRLGVRHEWCAKPAECVARLRRGGHTHVLAPRALLRDLPGDSTPAAPVRIGLLAPREYALQEMGGANVYVPLFALQLPPLLGGTAAVCRLPRRSGLNVAAITPLPFVSILIVDDNEVNVQVAEGLMAPYGMRMDHAYSGREAVKAVQAAAYDLVLMDHMMPDLDGVETTRLIRELPGGVCRELPIVALTANVTDEARRMFLDNGFNGFLAKPIETNALDRMLRHWLTEVNARRARQRKEETDPGGHQPGGFVGTADAGPEPPSGGTPSLPGENAVLHTAPPVGEVDFRAGAAAMPSAGMYPRLLGVYIRSTADILAKLPGWMDSDPERVVIEIHGLKSASASVGAMRFSGEAKYLELLGKQQRFEEVRAGLPAFLDLGNRVLEEMRVYLARDAAGEEARRP